MEERNESARIDCRTARIPLIITGSIERRHQSVGKEFPAGRTLTSLQRAQPWRLTGRPGAVSLR
jgi:hypothetical protein